jgi:hypothetical protein
VLGVWEVIGIQKDFNNFDLSLTLKYVKEYDATDYITNYTQGYLFNEFLWQNYLYSITDF